MSWRFSRSHDQTSIDCNRKGYLNYYAYGRGIVPKGLNLDQATGTLTHDLAAFVLNTMKGSNRLPTKGEIEEAVEKAVGRYKEEVEKRGFTDLAESVHYEIERQVALATAMCWAWVKVRGPFILENFEILEVEQERVVALGDDLELLSRLDAVCKRRSDGELFAGPEFKTTGWISDEYIEAWRYDAQTASHIIDVHSTYKKLPGGVMMEFLYKGSRRKGEDGGYTYFSPLVRGFVFTDPITGEMEYGHDSSLSRKKGWTAFDAWTFPGGILEWVESLPQDVLENHCYATTIYRSDAEVAQWLEQAIYRQSAIRTAITELRKEGETEEVHAAKERVIIAMQFPGRMDRYCYSNQYRRKCPYLGICFGAVDDPLGSGLFVAREPHHPDEFFDA